MSALGQLQHAGRVLHAAIIQESRPGQKRPIHRVDKRKIDKRSGPKMHSTYTNVPAGKQSRVLSGGFWTPRGQGDNKSKETGTAAMIVALRCLSLLTIVSETLTKCPDGGQGAVGRQWSGKGQETAGGSRRSERGSGIQIGRTA